MKITPFFFWWGCWRLSNVISNCFCRPHRLLSSATSVSNHVTFTVPEKKYVRKLSSSCATVNLTNTKMAQTVSFTNTDFKNGRDSI